MSRGIGSRSSRDRSTKRSTFMIFWRGVGTEFPEAYASQATGARTVLATPLLREGVAIGVIHDSPHRSPSVHRQTDRSPQNLCRPSGHRHRERAAVQGIAGAQRRIARGPGASDGDSRGARHHQPLADRRAAGARRHRRERRRVCGIDDVVLRLREGNIMVPRAHFGPIPILAASRSVLMSHSFAGCASMARSTFPTSARRTISQVGFRRRLAHLLGCSASSAGGTHWSD